MKLYKSIVVAICAFAFIACQSGAPSVSPTDVLKAQNEALKKKDSATMKQNISKASLALIETAAKAQQKTVDELLVLEVNGIKQPDSYEYRNEKIEGDKASLEVKAAGMTEWGKMPFVKEEGRWKIAFDQLIEDAKKAMQESQKSTENANTAK